MVTDSSNPGTETGYVTAQHVGSPPVPASVTAEQAALGAVVWAFTHGCDPAEVAEKAFAIASPAMFWRPQHETIAMLLSTMAAEGIPIDPQTVMARLRDNGDLARVGGAAYLHTLGERAFAVGNVEYYAAEVRECYRRRSILNLGVRIVQQSASPESDPDLLTVELAAALDEAIRLGSDDRIVLPATLADLLALDPRPEWIVPDLLEKKERVMVTGFEGLGKSLVLAQIAICLAAGIQPFSPCEHYDPLRVLVLDCENSLSILRRRYERIVAAVDGIAPGRLDRGRLMVEVREEGLDLTGGDDVAWLDRMLTGAKADVLVIGPLYKLHRANINDELAARGLTHTLDTMRVKHRVAMLIEAHSGQAEDSSGKRKLRPRGSSLFLGWPNVGIGIRPHRECKADPVDWVEVRSWRGHRETRAWPKELEHGKAYELPWVPVMRNRPRLAAVENE